MNVADQAQAELIRRAIELLNEEYESNVDFNHAFDGDEPLRMGGLELDRSKVLFWLERTGYYESRDDWLNQSLRDAHAPCVAAVRENEHWSAVRDLADAIKRGRLVPFVGAGMSRPMGLPEWKDAMRRLHLRIFTPPDTEVSALIEGGNYLEAAERLAGRSTALTNNFIRTTFRVQNVAGPILRLPNISRGCIVTTNFDDAIEASFARVNITFDGYMHGTQQHNFVARLVKGHRCLLKLHGDADDPQSYILTRNQYLAAYREPFDFHLPLPKALRQIYISNSLLFLGCSLEQDWTMELFRSVREAAEFEIPNHFAILPKPVNVGEAQTKAAALLELGIEPIWYPSGEHDYVDALLALAQDIADGRFKLED